MTIGLTDLLRRTRPFVITALPLVLLQACTPQDGDRVAAFLQGNPPPVDTRYALTTQSSSSAEPVVEQVAVTTEPSSSSEECLPYQWRAWMYDCHGNNLGPVE